MLQGKVTVVTGSTSGVGLGVTKVSAVIEHLDFKNAVLVGHSTGVGRATRHVAGYFIAAQTCFAGWLCVLLLASAAALFAPIVVAQGTIAPGAKVAVVSTTNCRMSRARACVPSWSSTHPVPDRLHIVTRLRPSSMRASLRER